MSMEKLKAAATKMLLQAYGPVVSFSRWSSFTDL